MEILFRDTEGKAITTRDIGEALKEVEADQCETLFIHSDIMFGLLEKGIKRNTLLALLYDQIMALGVKNLIIPTFTYSFPNKEDYDMVNSKTSMGAFNEYVRKITGRYRTDDPLLSVSIPEELVSAFSHISDHSLGAGSAFDIVHHMDHVKFLFFGAEMSDCFTYVHYVEKMMDVPYRFDMSFDGKVIYPNGEIKNKRQIIHTQCYGVMLPPKYDYFEQEMEEKGFLKKKQVGDKYIACLSEKDAYREIKSHIEKDINYYLAVPFKESDLIHQYTYSTENGRITHC
jgi:aminoglycoside 3-N-acetyltransferase